jgi:hypothetical protein
MGSKGSQSGDRVAEHPIKVLWNRVEHSARNHEAALGAEVPLEVAAAIATVPLYPPLTEEWAAVVNGVRLLYLVRVVRGPQWGTDAQHLTTDELVFSTFMTLSGLMDPSLLETEPWGPARVIAAVRTGQRLRQHA